MVRNYAMRRRRSRRMNFDSHGISSRRGVVSNRRYAAMCTGSLLNNCWAAIVGLLGYPATLLQAGLHFMWDCRRSSSRFISSRRSRRNVAVGSALHGPLHGLTTGDIHAAARR
ncbi:hypothetical protein Dimus_036028 [Dionaea muscipula]